MVAMTTKYLIFLPKEAQEDIFAPLTEPITLVGRMAFVDNSVTDHTEHIQRLTNEFHTIFSWKGVPTSDGIQIQTFEGMSKDQRPLLDACEQGKWSIRLANLPEVSTWHAALRADGDLEITPGKGLKELIEAAVESAPYKSLLLSFRGDLADCALQFIQNLMDEIPADDFDHRHGLRRLLVRLSTESACIPNALFLHGIAQQGSEPVGIGGFADVYRGVLGEKPVALKRLRVFVKDTNSRDLNFFCREALVWRQLRHKHILPFLGVDNDTFSSYLCMVSPWLSNGDVASCMELLEQRGEAIPFNRWIREIAEGMDYLHTERTVHGDLRGPNILIDENLSVRLADFGLAQFSDSSTSTLGSQLGGATRWMAPELVLQGERSSFASDVYALACVCLEIYSQKRPFAAMNDAQIIAQLMKDLRPARIAMKSGREIPDDVWELIEKCWATDPEARPTMSEVVSYASRLSAPVEEPSELGPSQSSSDYTDHFGTHAVDEMRSLIQDACKSKLYREVLLSVRDELADRALCSLLENLNGGGNQKGLIREEDCQAMRGMLFSISHLAKMLPSSIYINDVDSSTIKPTRGGVYAEIFKATRQGTPVSLKRLRIVQSPHAKDFFVAFCHEALIWNQARHPNILPFLGVDHQSLDGSLCLVSPWSLNGNMRLYLKKTLDLEIHKEHMGRWLEEIGSAVEYLHRQHIVHSELRLGNIMLDEHLHVQLAHFNLAFCTDETILDVSGHGFGLSGFERWMAPEMLTAGVWLNYGTDVYAFGCLAVEMYTNDVPFREITDINPRAVIEKVMQGGRPGRPGDVKGDAKMSDGLWTLIQRCWLDPPERTTMTEFVIGLKAIGL